MFSQHSHASQVFGSNVDPIDVGEPPHIALPHIALPHIALPHIALPHIALPHIALPHISVSTFQCIHILVFKSHQWPPVSKPHQWPSVSTHQRFHTSVYPHINVPHITVYYPPHSHPPPPPAKQYPTCTRGGGR